LRPKNLIGGDLLDPGAGRLVEHAEQEAGPLARLARAASQGRHARDGGRPRHDSQESPGHAQADPLGLGDGGELVLLVGSDLDGVFETLPESIDLGLPLGQLLLKLVDSAPGRGAVDGIGDLPGFAVERLAGSLTVLGHWGDVTIVTT
jgi:hypothetical protein